MNTAYDEQILLQQTNLDICSRLVGDLHHKLTLASLCRIQQIVQNVCTQESRSSFVVSHAELYAKNLPQHLPCAALPNVRFFFRIPVGKINFVINTELSSNETRLDEMWQMTERGDVNFLLCDQMRFHILVTFHLHAH